MYRCIANNENLFLVLDTNDGVCEWTPIQDCRKYLESGVPIEGLVLRQIDSNHKYLDYTPVTDFIPNNIVNEIKSKCTNTSEFNKIVTIIRSYILKGNNIIKLRRISGSFNDFVRNLTRWCYNG